MCRAALCTGTAAWHGLLNGQRRPSWNGYIKVTMTILLLDFGADHVPVQNPLQSKII